MPRSLSPSVLAQVLSNQLQPALFVRIAFLTETVYIWSGLGSISVPGPAYDPTNSFPYGAGFTGIGWMGQIRAIPQVSDIIASNVTLELSGIPVELVTDAINSVRQNSIATIWLGLMNGTDVIGDPVQLFQGSLDVPTITEGATTCNISITCENPLIDLGRAPSRRYTDVDQQIDFPGDTGFFQVQLLQDYNLVWPTPVPGTANTTPPPSYLTISPGGTAPIAVKVGNTVQLKAVETRSDGATTVVMGPGQPGSSWGGPSYSSDPSIATVDGNGLVHGVKQGMCNITKRFVQSEFAGSGANKPSSCVTASVTIVVTS